MMGQNRLSIIDLSPAGHQPMQDCDGRFTIVYNGEVYNYVELRSELEALGYRFKSNSDTEVVINAYAAWGKACLGRFTGMFAFIIYDSRTRTLFGARDFFGIKPFFYRFGENGLSFASELPALLEIPGSGRKLQHQKAYDYLVLGRADVGADTMLQDIHQLPPGHCFMIRVDDFSRIAVERYWKIDLEKKAELSFEAAVVKLRELFLDSVCLHLRSDVPLGVALSGGIDSTAIACAIRRLYPEATIHTFSYVASDSLELSEEKWIDIANERIGAIPHKVVVSPEEMFSDLETIVERMGEPFQSTSMYAQYRVFKLVRESGITVTLDGQGADELLAGYTGYPAYRIESLVRSGHFIGALRYLDEASHWPGRSKKTIALESLERFVPKALKGLGLAVIGRSIKPDWINVEYLREQGVAFRYVVNESAYRHKDRLRAKLAAAATEMGLANLLRYEDRNAMTWSVESRVPFCTREIAEFVLSLPEEYLVSGQGETKHVFRAAMRGIVPDSILDRRDKIGFQTPEKDWFPSLAAWVKPILEAGGQGKILDRAELLKDWNMIESGRKCYDGLFWRKLNYLVWSRKLGIEE
jgi:asparagine synthase (glutamine-hydrolyzing)